MLINKKVSLELAKDGFAKDSLVTFSQRQGPISFTIENRENKGHYCTVSVKNMVVANYDVLINGAVLSQFSVNDQQNTNQINIRINNATEKITVMKR